MTNKRSQSAKQYLFVTVMVALLLSVFLEWSGPLSTFENRLWDIRQKLAADTNQADRSVKIITISQRSLDYFAEQGITWPWPRAMYGPVLEFLSRAGAKGAGIDLLFTESSSYGLSDDLDFAEKMNLLPTVNAFAFIGGEPDEEQEKLIDQFNLKTAASESELFELLKNSKKYKSALLPIPELQKTTNSFGSVNAEPDGDGIFRHYPIGGWLADTPHLSLPFALYNTLSKEVPAELAAKSLSDGSLAIRFYGKSGTFETYEFAEVINSLLAVEKGESGVIDLEEFKDSWVFIGVWAPGLLDLRPTPLDERFRGVEYLATVFSNLLNNHFIIHPNTLVRICISWALVAAFFLVCISVSGVFYQLLSFLSLGFVYTLLTFASVKAGIWLPLAVPALVLLLTFVSSLLIYFAVEQKDHRFIKKAFGQYVSPTVISQIVSDPGSLDLGGERRELSMLFSDLAGFSTFSEKLEPEKLVTLLNDYLTEMTGIILDQGGTLDKYQGDAIIAFWNAPLKTADHADKAVKSALLCQRRLAELNEDYLKTYGLSLKVRVGIHTGEVVVGNIGSKRRFNYTIMGDAANLASRLEGVNKVFGTETLVSENTVNSVIGSEIEFRKIAKITVVGREQPVSIYQPYQSDDGSELKYKEFKASLDSFEAGDIPGAKAGFEKLINDPVAKVYLKRISGLRDLSKDSWSAIWNLTEK